MKIAFIHYHLKTGGVTTVLRQQVEAVRDDGEILVLTGEQPEEDFPADVKVIPGLGYDGTFDSRIRAEEISEAVIGTIRSKWPAGCDLLHVHNPTLAKNRMFLRILKALQKNGVKLFLQIHDLAEDGRPAVYSDEEYVPDCHYGVINSRDYDILLRAGLSEKGLHKTVNAINPISGKGVNGKTDRNIVLYPIRAIRRKNIGEAVLLSLFFSQNESLYITLPPNSPADKTSYDGWKTYANENHIDVVFEAGLKEPFEELVAASKFLITTSISEGFGFSFLEPWTAGKMVWGRNLPEITRDFELSGVNLGHLYHRFNVPVRWIGKQRFMERWASCFAATIRKFDFPSGTPMDTPMDTPTDTSTDKMDTMANMNRKEIKDTIEKSIPHGAVDFGLLDEPLQKEIISRVLSEQAAGDELESLNPFLAEIGDLSEKTGLIESNGTAVIRNYNRGKSRHRLMNIYSNVIRQPIRHRIDKRNLLSQFLNLKNFSLLKWNDYGM